MKKTPLLLATVTLLASCHPSKPPTAKELLQNIARMYSNHRSVSYAVDYKWTPYGEKKPHDYPAHCSLVRDTKDSVFNGYILENIACFGGYGRYYNMDKIYEFDDSLKKTKVFDNPKKEYWAIEGNGGASGVKNIYFLQPKELLDIAKDSTLKDSLGSDKIGEAEYWKLTIKYPDEKDMTDKCRIIWVNKNDTTIKKMSYSAVYQGQTGIKEWNIDSMVFDKATPESLAAQTKNKIASYTSTTYVPPSADFYNLIDNGQPAPEFTVTDYTNGKTVSLKQLKGKVVFLDFMYMNCPWCITALPEIEAIEDKYKAKGLVMMAIDHYDTSAADRKRLPDFARINKMNYPVMLASYKTDSAYKIKAYPTLYIIDKKGNVAFTHMGYHKNMDSIVSPILTKALGK